MTVPEVVNDLARKTIRGFAQLVTALGIRKKDRKLLERRLNAGPGAENESSQKVIQLLASLAFMGAMILPSLDHRFSWSAVPLPITITGDVLVALGFLIVFLVGRTATP